MTPVFSQPIQPEDDRRKISRKPSAERSDQVGALLCYDVTKEAPMEAAWIGCEGSLNGWDVTANYMILYHIYIYIISYYLCYRCHIILYIYDILWFLQCGPPR
jgi:hypothetical protein